LRRRKEIFYCILQSKRVKDERILENYSRESVCQKGLGLNPKRTILKILSSFTSFECRMIRRKNIPTQENSVRSRINGLDHVLDHPCFPRIPHPRDHDAMHDICCAFASSQALMRVSYRPAIASLCMLGMVAFSCCFPCHACCPLPLCWHGRVKMCLVGFLALTFLVADPQLAASNVKLTRRALGSGKRIFHMKYHAVSYTLAPVKSELQR